MKKFVWSQISCAKHSGVLNMTDTTDGWPTYELEKRTLPNME